MDSESFAHVFLEGLNGSDSEEAQPYFMALNHFLLVKDEF